MPSAPFSDFAKLKRLVRRFQGVRLGVLGDLMLDRYLWGTANRLSPEAAVPIVEFVSETECLGGAGNVAANLSALGAHVELFGVIGGRGSARKGLGDQAGIALRRCLHGVHIGDRGVVCDDSAITIVKTRVIARHQQIVRIDREHRETPPPALHEKMFRLIVQFLKQADGFIISDYDKGLLNDALAERVLHACHKFKVPVFVKPKTSRLFPYRGARIVVCNAKEASTYASRSLHDEAAVAEVGRALLAGFGCASVIITRGEKGMSVFEESSSRHLHIPATSFEVTYDRVGKPGVDRNSSGRQVFDVTGAGDTVLSALSLALAAGANLPDAAFLANTIAGVVVGKLGTATVSPHEVDSALADLELLR